MDNDTKRDYEAPRLTNEGSVRDLTLGEANGEFLDKTYPVTTPKPQLTFTN